MRKQFEFSRNDAVSRLRAIKRDLLPTLQTKSEKVELNHEELNALTQLKELLLDEHNWLEDSHVVNQAGLSVDEIALLTKALAHYQDDKMRELYDLGNG